MPEFIDDKSEHCIPFVLEQVEAHQKRHANDPNPPPFFLGLNGVQGAGKTVLVTSLRETLSASPYNLPTISFSLDDIYLTHEDQTLLTRCNPKNPLFKHRGQPATHDVPLGLRVFDGLRKGEPTKIPAYDKSAFNGEGDRAPEDQWETVNDVSKGQKRIKVVIFEGWCVGFRARDDQDLYNAWSTALGMRRNYTYDGQLGYLDFEHVKVVNKALKAYDVFTDQLDAFIHIDAQNIHYVYDWRQEQEENLRAAKGTGMTIEQVNKFVGGYYSSYELYTSILRQGVFNPEARIQYNNGTDKKPDEDWRGRQLRLVLNQERRVLEVIRI